MKKVLVIGSFLLLAGTTLKAQHAEFGVKAGLSASNVEIDNGPDYDARPGGYIGGLVHIHLSKYFALQPELVFSAQGGKSGGDYLHLNYINMPLLGQFMFGKGWRLQTGPQLGALVSAKQEIDDEINRDVDDAFKKVDMSWVFGASYIFPVGVGLDARFNVGVSDISDIRNVDARNRVFQVGAFYQFMHNKRR